LSVLEIQPPRFNHRGEVAQIAEQVFGLQGTATDLGSERDATFLIDDGGDGAVLKIPTPARTGPCSDLEHAAIEHVLRIDPKLPVARLLAERATFDGHHVRLFERLHGRTGGPALDDAAIRAFAETHARLNVALRSLLPPGRRARAAVEPRRTRRGSVRCSTRSRIVSAAQSSSGSWTRSRSRLRRPGRACARRSCTRTSRSATSSSTRTTASPAIVDFGDCAWSAQVADFAVALGVAPCAAPER
jgi:Ser/Thr protein kinase RdoA (MazF antagonist)